MAPRAERQAPRSPRLIMTPPVANNVNPATSALARLKFNDKELRIDVLYVIKITCNKTLCREIPYKSRQGFFLDRGRIIFL